MHELLSIILMDNLLLTIISHANSFCQSSFWIDICLANQAKYGFWFLLVALYEHCFEQNFEHFIEVVSSNTSLIIIKIYIISDLQRISHLLLNFILILDAYINSSQKCNLIEFIKRQTNLWVNLFVWIDCRECPVNTKYGMCGIKSKTIILIILGWIRIRNKIRYDCKSLYSL